MEPLNWLILHWLELTGIAIDIILQPACIAPAYVYLLAVPPCSRLLLHNLKQSSASIVRYVRTDRPFPDTAVHASSQP